MANATIYTGNSAPANVRATKSTGSLLLGTLANGTTVNVVRCDATWATLQFNGTPAFIWNSLLTGEPTQNGAGLSTASGMNTAKCNGTDVNVRASAVSGNVVGQLDKGDSVSILQSATGSDAYVWYRIGTNQWVRGDFLAPGGSGGSGGGSGGGTIPAVGWGKITTGSTGVNIRDQASTASGVQSLGQWNGGSVFKVLGNVGSWVKIQLGRPHTPTATGDEAYISSAYVSTHTMSGTSFTEHYCEVAKSFAGQNGETAFHYSFTGYGSWCQAFTLNMAIMAGLSNAISKLPQTTAKYGTNTNTWNVYRDMQDKGCYNSTYLSGCTLQKGDWLYYRRGTDNMSHVGIIVGVNGRSIQRVEGCIKDGKDSAGKDRYIVKFYDWTTITSIADAYAVVRPNW